MKKILSLLLLVAGTSSIYADDVNISSYFSVPTNGHYYIYNIGAGKFIKTTSNPSATSDTPEMETVTRNDDGTFMISGKSSTSSLYYVKTGYYGGQYVWSDWTSGTDNPYWTIAAVDAADATQGVTISSSVEVTLNGTTGTYYWYVTGSKVNGSTDTNVDNRAFGFITPADYNQYLLAKAKADGQIEATDWTFNYTQWDALKAGNNGKVYTEGDINYVIGSSKVFPDGTKICKTYFNLPNGDYQVTAEAQHWTSGKDVYAYATSGTNDAQYLLTKTSNTKEDVTLAPITVTDNTLEVGVRTTGENTDGSMGISDITITPAAYTRSTTSGKYGTICLPFAATATNANVYSATVSDDGKYVNLTEKESLEAGKPYVYKAGVSAQTFTYSPIAIGDAVATAQQEGCLVGLLADGTAPAGSYVLQTQNNVQAFYYCNAAHAVTANHCYLTTSTPDVKAIGIGMDVDHSDGIHSYSEASTSSVMYDLSGRRVNRTQKGIYIINGKKIVR